MNAIDKFEKWCADCEWPNETLVFHLSMYTQTYPARVSKMLHELILEHRGDPQGEDYDAPQKKGSYGFGDPSRLTARPPSKED